MPAKSQCQREHRCRPLPALCSAFQRSEQAEIVLKVLGGNAGVSGDPGLQPAVIRIDLLDMPLSAPALAGAQVQGLMMQRQFLGCAGHRRRAIGEQDGVAMDAGLHRFAQTGLGDRLQQEVSRRPRTVSDNQNRHQIHAPRFTRRMPATPARLAPRTLTFARAQEEGPVGLDHASEFLGVHSVRQLQESVTPAKCRRRSHIQCSCRLVHAEPLEQHILLLQPLGLHAQPGQWCGRQQVERAPTGPAFLALQPAGAAVTHDPAAHAVRAHRRLVQARLRNRANFRVIPACAQRLQKIGPLPHRQLGHCVQQKLQFCCFQRPTPTALQMGQSGQLWCLAVSRDKTVTNLTTAQRALICAILVAVVSSAPVYLPPAERLGINRLKVWMVNISFPW